MTTFKTSLIAILLLNLACVSNATMTTQTAMPFVTSTQTTTPALCAVVVAVQSLNLRDHADGAVIDYLAHDEVVQVIDNQGEWWQVQTDSNIGFAHSAYLQIVECAK